jgi:hypothetical protein
LFAGAGTGCCAGAAGAVGGRSLRISSAGATGRIDRRGGVVGTGAFGSGAGAWFDALRSASPFDAVVSGSGFFESRGGFFWKIREKTLIYFPPRAAAT